MGSSFDKLSSLREEGIRNAKRRKSVIEKQSSTGKKPDDGEARQSNDARRNSGDNSGRR